VTRVGPVTAMEIIGAFPGVDGMKDFKEWLKEDSTKKEVPINVVLCCNVLF
jgi:hypothetical protein